MKFASKFQLGFATVLCVLFGALPVVAQVSDDFSAPLFDDTLWTTIDPVGDSSFNQTGGRLTISVPAGASHDLWTSGNNSARIVQPTADGDFEVEAKFESTPNAQFQIQGLLVQQDSQNYIRLDYYHDGTSLHVYTSAFTSDLPTNFANLTIANGNSLFLRLARTGNQWQAQYSYDGTNWSLVANFNHTLTVSGSGVYAGNVGFPAPAYDAIVDYFFNTASPIDPEDGGIVDVTPPVVTNLVTTPAVTSVQITFTTDEPALGRVAYGLTNALELGIIGGSVFQFNHTLDLTGLTPETTYFMQVEAEDSSTNLALEPVTQFTTLAVPNELPSVTLDSPTGGTSYIDGDAVFMSATASDNDGTVDLVEFLADGAVVGSAIAAPWDFTWTTAPVGNHDLTARATDNDGGMSLSAAVAITVNPPLGAPVAVSDDFSALNFDNVLWTVVDPIGDGSIGQTNGLLTIAVPGNTDHDVWTGGNNSVRVMQPVVDADIQVEAKFESSPLQASQMQGILIEDDASNYIRFDYFHDGANLRVFGASFINDVPTVRLNLAVPSGSLLWLRLARTGDQWLGEYSFDGVNWSQGANFSHPMTMNNVGVFAGNAGSPAPAFNAVVDYFFDTNDPIVPEDGGVVDVVPPVISAVNTVPGVTDATITFSTDELALGRVHYGLTAGLELGTIAGPGFLTNHTIVLPGLTAQTLYFYQVEAEDSSTNLAQEPIAQFTTLAVPNDPPLVTLDAPLSGTHFADGDTVFMVATASDNDGTVTMVEFLADGGVVGTVMSAPWDFAWGTAPVGNHDLTARATDNDGGVTVSNLAAITVDPALGAPVAVSDDFSALAFDNALWTLVDPVGDSSLYQANGLLTLSVPGGTDHDLWTGGNETARIVQSVANSDIGLEVKFETMPVSPFQIQGLLLEESPGNYIRLDYYHDGLDLHLFGASFVADNPTVRGNITLPASSLLWIGVTRLGDSFTVNWSDDGVIWQTAFSFSHALILNKVGVYAGNAGSPAPAFDVVVDYFFDTNAPVIPEDDGVIDIWPPVVSNIDVVPDPDTGTAVVTCTTNEPATTLLSFGLTASYGTDVIGTTSDGLNHQFLLSGLVLDMAYHFSIEASDTLSNAAATVDQQFLNVEIKPVIAVWGGLNQRVGHLGLAQADFNLVGNIFLWENLATLAYSLNGGVEQPLNWGNQPDGFGDWRRLARNGDFNVDLPISQMLMGPNTITVHAVALDGKEDIVTATVTRETGSSPFPVIIDWDTVAVPQDVGQTVDGDWTHDVAGLRTISTGYDRLFLLGEDTWQDYEIVCPITIHEVQVPGPRSDTQGMGFIMRFTGHIVGGHRNWPDVNPKWGYQPFGAIGWLRWLSGLTGNPTIQFYQGDYDVVQNFGGALTVGDITTGEKTIGPEYELDADPKDVPFGEAAMVTNFGLANIQIGETFFMKMRCETLADAPNGDGVTQYSYKVWLNTEAEPVAWDFQVVQQSEFALRRGGPALVAHHIDVTFGDITVFELSGPASVEDDQLPNRFALADNYPNPFNPLTQIAFEVPRDGNVKLVVFDIRGRHVTTLVSESMAAGAHSVFWDGTDRAGQTVASGQYFYRLDTGGLTAVKKMLLLK